MHARNNQLIVDAVNTGSVALVDMFVTDYGTRINARGGEPLEITMMT